VDYRKQRRKKEQLMVNKKNDLSSTEEEEFQHFDQLRTSDGQNTKILAQRANDPLCPSSANSTPKVVLRNHERLFDKKIVNRKRFSQVVMCDEEEIFQFNQNISANSLTKNSDNNTLKYSENNDSINNDNNSYQQRFMEHVSEEEEECFGEEEEEDDSSDQFRCRKQLLTAKGDSANEFGLTKPSLNHSNLSTIATNSECVNVGSIRNDDVDEDSYRSDKNHPIQKVPLNTSIDADPDREGIGVDEDDDDEEEEEEEEDDEV